MTFRVGFGAVNPHVATAIQQLVSTPTLVSSGDDIIMPASGAYTRDVINQLDAYRMARRNTRMLTTQATLAAQGVAGGPCWKPGDPAKLKPRGTAVLACAGWPNPDPMTREALALIMYPLGTALYLDVPFNVAEYVQAIQASKVSGNFALTRSYTPDPEQRIVAVKAIMDASIRALADAVTKASSNLVGGGSIDDLSIARVITIAKQQGEDLTTNVAGYAFNPIPPTNEEMNNPGGWKKYGVRGGFLLSPGIVAGIKPIGGKVFAYYGQYCTCSGTSVGQPYTAGGGVLDVYLKAAGTSWTMTLKPRDRSAFQAVVGTIYDGMTTFGKLLCTAAPIITNIDKSLIAEQCIDKKKKPCTKGSKDCTCTKPTTGQEVGVGLANFALNYWCGKAQGLINEQPPPIFDPNAQPPIVAPPASAPWWLIPLGAGVIGYLILRK